MRGRIVCQVGKKLGTLYEDGRRAAFSLQSKGFFVLKVKCHGIMQVEIIIRIVLPIEKHHCI